MQREIITFVFRGETIHLFLGTLIAEVYPCCLFSNLKLLVGEFYVYIYVHIFPILWPLYKWRLQNEQSNSNSDLCMARSKRHHLWQAGIINKLLLIQEFHLKFLNDRNAQWDRKDGDYIWWFLSISQQKPVIFSSDLYIAVDCL